MKIVVLGAAGMLGHKMFQRLRERYPGTVATARENVRVRPLDRVDLLQGEDVIPGVDAMNVGRLGELLSRLKPDFVVNCVGIIKQRDEARTAIPCIAINALLPHQLEALASGWGGRVIPFSTDCVFDGRRGRYTEEDASTAEDLYGKSKSLGEVASDHALTLRTSIIGRELVEFRSLLEWFLAQKGKTISGFTKVVYSGVTTNYLADLVGDLIQEHPSLSGLYQVVGPAISKYDLLLLLKEAYGLDTEIVPDDREVTDRSMLGDKFFNATGYMPPAWPELISKLASDPTPYDKWR
jgi:dTDP-4-dehydrorhamnose reductase